MVEQVCRGEDVSLDNSGDTTLLTDHHVDGRHVELGIAAVHEGGLQLLGGDGPGLVGVNSEHIRS